jgi:hypothetical protein
LLLPASGQDFRATDEGTRINAQRPADEAEYQDCADPEAGAAGRETTTILYPIACR